MQATAQISHSVAVMRQMLIFAAEFSGGGIEVACGLAEVWVMTIAFSQRRGSFRRSSSFFGPFRGLVYARRGTAPTYAPEKRDACFAPVVEAPRMLYTFSQVSQGALSSRRSEGFPQEDLWPAPERALSR